MKRKKTVLIIVLAVVIVAAIVLAVCLTVIPKHEHNYVTRIVEPTCTEQGYTLHTCECDDSYKDTFVDATGHTEVTDEAVAATCTTDGKTQGSHCEVCNEVLVAQTVIKASHTEVTDEAVEATCTTDGKTQGSHCEVCNEVLVAQTVIKASHTEITDEAVEATCTADGKAQGSHCEVCNEVLTAQTTIPALGHSYVNGKCVRCGDIKLATEGLKYTLSYDGTYYSVSGYGTATDIDVIIPETYEGKPVKFISSNAFSLCTSIKSVTIKGAVSIGSYAFSGCTALESVRIGSGSTFIDDGAFSGCTALTSAIFEDTDGWMTKSGSFKKTFTSDELADPEIAAEYLSNSYCKYYTWTKT